MSARQPVLAVAAWDPELERLRALAGGGLAGAHELRTRAIGIGLVDATAGATRALAELRPERVILVGTCGASPTSGLRVGDVIVGTRVRLVEPAVVEGRAAIPFGEEPAPLDASPGTAGARPATVANTLAVTTDDALARALAAEGEVEHLEAYGVARACALAGVRCTVVLGVANMVGSTGRDEWRANHVAASACAAEVVWAMLTEGRG